MPMTVEVRATPISKIMSGSNPLESPLVAKVEPGAPGAGLLELLPNGKHRLLVVVCDADNSEARIYRVDDSAFEWNSENKIIVDDSSDKDFPMHHHITVFPSRSLQVFARTGLPPGALEVITLTLV